MFIAEKLHKTVSEILQMDAYEFNMWLAYFSLKNDEIKQQQNLQKRN
jgi:nicotinic acid phosphoribosyltransferase